MIKKSGVKKMKLPAWGAQVLSLLKELKYSLSFFIKKIYMSFKRIYSDLLKVKLENSFELKLNT